MSIIHSAAKSVYWKFYVKIFPHMVILVRRELEGCKSFLDLGCGRDSPVKHFSKEFYCVGVDVFKPFIEESRKKGIHDEYTLMNVTNLKFKPRSYDAVLALDLIEHLPKDEGKKLLRTMEKIAKKRVIVFTPNEFLKQDELEGNKYQVHKSGWTVSEMRERGYRVMGVGGAKFLRGRGRLAHLRGKGVVDHYMYYFWWAVSDITQLFTYHFPEYAFQLLCVKDVDKEV
ncbi:MAG: class I SAM-dependent methyltransferase [Candidatus Micrarchaeota archaeon]|nr:class I SAM-dependent methyltransferase [Candidatus Micrarchaeota archaeon]